MRIRDLGSTVELWIKAGYASTYVYSLSYNYTVNGKKNYATGKYPKGGYWVKLKTFTVTTPQTVGFGIGATNTSGLGGPTSFTAFLRRGDVRVRYNGVWENADAYVKSSDKWYPAQAYVKYNGEWVRT